MRELVEHFRQPALAWLVQRLVKRVQQGKPLDGGTLRLSSPSPEQRRAADNLLGRPASAGGALAVPLAQLAAAIPGDLHEVLTELRGPIRNLRAEREAETQAWRQLEARWRERLKTDPVLEKWLEKLFRDGSLKRHAGRDTILADQWLAAAAQILATDDHGGILLASLAAAVSGDSHALDRNQVLGSLCLRGIQIRSGIDGSEDATARRRAWFAIGVEVDDLSAPVLCLNVAAAPGCDAAGWIDWHRHRGQPFHLAWRQIKTFAPDPAMPAVFVCENPAVVSEAANRLGPGSHALICLNGRPNAAVKALLASVAAAGVPLHVRADFDWAGMRILSEVHDPERTRLWRMDPETYAACQAGQSLTGVPYIRPWNAALATAMKAAGHAGYEEEVIEVLLQDLSSSQ